MPAYQTTALTFANAKDALLYFDYVIPLRIGSNSITADLPAKGDRKIIREELLRISQDKSSQLRLADTVDDLLSALRPDLKRNHEFIERISSFDIKYAGF